MMNQQIMMDEIIDQSKKIIALKDENYELKDRIKHLEYDSHVYNRLIDNNLICNTCRGVGSVGSPPDDYFDCPDCAKQLNKIKAAAIREAASNIDSFSISLADGQYGRVYWEVTLFDYADKIERGEC